MDVTLVRWFNLIYAVALAGIVAIRIFQRSYKVYRWANISYLAAFIYTISAYVWTFAASIPMPPVVSALGATVQIAAMSVAIFSQWGRK